MITRAGVVLAVVTLVALAGCSGGGGSGGPSVDTAKQTTTHVKYEVVYQGSFEGDEAGAGHRFAGQHSATYAPGTYDDGIIRSGYDNGVEDARVNAVNNQGQLAGTMYVGFNHYVVFWPDIAAPENREIIPAVGTPFVTTGLNDSGQVVANGDVTAAVWEKLNGVWKQFDMPGANNVDGGINNVGQIAGSTIVGGTEYPAIWRKQPGLDGPPVLERTLDKPGTGARAINDNGLVVGAGFLWGSFGMKTLSPLGGAYKQSYPYDINTPATGPVQIVGESNTSTFTFKAVLWEWNGSSVVIYDLTTLIEPALGWTLRRAWAISDDGWIAARGVNQDDVWTGVILKPKPQ